MLGSLFFVGSQWSVLYHQWSGHGQCDVMSGHAVISGQEDFSQCSVVNQLFSGPPALKVIDLRTLLI